MENFLVQPHIRRKQRVPQNRGVGTEGYFHVWSLPQGERVAWIVRVVKTGAISPIWA
jgi:hypothetical protein